MRKIKEAIRKITIPWAIMVPLPLTFLVTYSVGTDGISISRRQLVVRV